MLRSHVNTFVSLYYVFPWNWYESHAPPECRTVEYNLGLASRRLASPLMGLGARCTYTCFVPVRLQGQSDEDSCTFSLGTRAAVFKSAGRATH